MAELTPHDILQKFFGYDTFREHQQDVIDQLLAGADAFVVKPCDPSDLLRVVERVLSQRGRRLSHAP